MEINTIKTHHPPIDYLVVYYAEFGNICAAVSLGVCSSFN